MLRKEISIVIKLSEIYSEKFNLDIDNRLYPFSIENGGYLMFMSGLSFDKKKMKQLWQYGNPSLFLTDENGEVIYKAEVLEIKNMEDDDSDEEFVRKNTPEHEQEFKSYLFLRNLEKVEEKIDLSQYSYLFVPYHNGIRKIPGTYKRPSRFYIYREQTN